MPFDDNAILARTLPEEDVDPSEFQKLLQRARTSGGKLITPPLVEPETPPEDSTWDKEFQKQKQRYMGLDQKYNPDGSPRKKSVMEKILAGVNTLGTAIAPNSYANIRQRTKDSLETGERTRIAKIAADQRREQAELVYEAKIAELMGKATAGERNAKITQMLAEGKITKAKADALYAESRAKQVDGVTNRTSEEGKSRLGLIDSQTGLNKAKTAGSMTVKEQIEKLILEGKWKAHIASQRGQYGPTGTRTFSKKNQDGDLVEKGSDRVYGPTGRPIIPEPANPYDRTGPLPGGTGRDEALGAPVQAPRAPGIQDPGFSIPPPGASTRPPVALPPRVTETLTSGRNNLTGGNLTWDARGTASKKAMMPEKFADKLHSANAFIKTVTGMANQVTGAYVSGVLDKSSGIYGSPLATMLRETFGDKDPSEAITKQMGTKLFGTAETSDFGNRVLQIQAKSESGALPPQTANARNKVATYIGQAYSRAVSAWAEVGDEEQQKVAKEILTTESGRLDQLEKSVAAYLSVLDAQKQAKAAGKEVGRPPNLSPNLYILTRTDDELRKLFPSAKTAGQLKMIRVFGGLNGSTQKFSDKPATPAVDNRKLLDRL